MSSTEGTKLTLLVDNRAKQGLTVEHGLSIWIETAGRNLLFDTGQGAALQGNARSLGVDLTATDTLILSHGHYDHTGGVPQIVDGNPGVQVFVHPSATGPRYSIRDGAAKSIAMPEPAKSSLSALPPGSVHWVTEPVELIEGVGITGPIPRLEPEEDVGGPFFIDVRGSKPDPIEDDLALWISTNDGLVVVMGCGHAGLINTLQYAKRVSGVSKIHTVLGGFHLVEASESRLERTIEALESLQVDRIVPCHCTGGMATQILKERLGDQVAPGQAGETYRF